MTTYFKLLGIEIAIQKLTKDFGKLFDTMKTGERDRDFLLFGRWHLVCSW